MPRSPFSQRLQRPLRNPRLTRRFKGRPFYLYATATTRENAEKTRRFLPKSLAYRIAPLGDSGMWGLYLPSEPYAAATAQAQREGFMSFAEGTPGQKRRRAIVAAMKHEEERGRIHRDD